VLVFVLCDVCFIIFNYIHVDSLTQQIYILTLSLLMSYIYGAPSKARNLTYIYGRDFYWEF
jgi:hypothetical protein